MAFDSRHPVRHPDVDRAGIVYFPRFYDFFHRALEDFFQEEAGLSYWALEETHHVALPIVHVETDFVRPLAHGDVVTVVLETLAVGTSSLTVRYRVFRPGHDEAAAVSKAVHCAIEVPSWKKIPVPPAIRAAFEKHLVTR